VTDETIAAVAAPSKVSQARAIRREVMDAHWPGSREARAAIHQRLGYLRDQLDVYDRLVNDEMGWAEFDPDLEVFDGDPRVAAVAIAGENAYDAALALKNELGERRRREAEATGRAREWLA